MIWNQMAFTQQCIIIHVVLYNERKRTVSADYMWNMSTTVQVVNDWLIARPGYSAGSRHGPPHQRYNGSTVYIHVRALQEYRQTSVICVFE